MTVADYIAPDPIVLARELLLDTSEVTAYVSTRVLSRTGDALPTLPYIRLDLVGGTPIDDRYLDQARLQVHVFGASESEVATLAACQAARAAFVSARSWAGTTGIISGTRIESGPALFHDETHTPPLVDATFSVALLIRV